MSLQILDEKENVANENKDAQLDEQMNARIF